MNTSTSHTDDDLLTVSDVAEMLHASRATVFRILRAGTLPSIKVGKSRLVRRGTLHRFIRAQESAA
ncbi:MAG: helix-turn-helix domain-containing protein [Microthrixaceae bacterium]|nr:helix-turn-helix domain-containing protein [Microthrixaceae bacterium]